MLFNKLFAGCVLSMTCLGVFASPLPALVPRSAGSGLDLPTGTIKVEIGIAILERNGGMYYGIVLNERVKRHLLVLDDSESAVKDHRVFFTTRTNPDPATHHIFDPKMQVEVDLTSALSHVQQDAESLRICMWIKKVINDLFRAANGKGMSVDVERTITDSIFQRERLLGITTHACPASLHKSSDAAKPNGALRVDTSHTILSNEELEKGRLCHSPTTGCEGTLSPTHTFQPNQHC
ncbi:hypothetical protein EV361DRAFT_939474 [Lentinula raphanica]|nr:hypothetical protein EV361DRAFT_939474 [Lentinula raphanica]